MAAASGGTPVDRTAESRAGAPPSAHCRGCGRTADDCGADCGRREGPPRFCTRCGRRLQEIAVNPGLVEAWCRDHGPGGGEA